MNYTSFVIFPMYKTLSETSHDWSEIIQQEMN